MAKKMITVLAVLLLFVGAAVFFYPTVQQWHSREKEEKTIKEYETALAETADADTEGLQKLLEEIQSYNDRIRAEGQQGIKDPFAYEQESFDLSQWGIAEKMFGYVRIPKMDLELPLYLGASEENMRLGAAHLSQTSIPIGGSGTNAVIAAHRGMSGAMMFREIEKLESGDRVYIRNPWQELEYQVVETKIVDPDDVEQIMIQEGRDMVTLLTCHPYPKNTYRYLVYCERVADGTSPAYKQETNAGTSGENRKTSVVDIEKYVRIGIAGVLLAGIILWFLHRLRRFRK